MKHYLVILFLIGLFLGPGFHAYAQDTLSIRLIAASNEGTRRDAGLEDLKGLLDNVPFNSFSNFTVLNNERVRLPAAKVVKNLQHNIVLSLSGPAGNLDVHMQRGDQNVRSVLNLQPRRPFSYAGFRAGATTLIIVLVVE